MALIHCDFHSHVLGLAVSMDVILPQPPDLASRPADTRWPTLYLLHGLSDDHTMWQRRTSIERYAAAYPLAIVMPAVHRSFYTDMAQGYRYWTFLSEELPALAQAFFPLSDQRQDNYVAGLSMGGYGAFKLGLGCPERFAAAASLSGALDMAHRLESAGEDNLGPDMRLVYGDPPSLRGTPNDLLHLAAELAASDTPAPRLYQCCGTEDFLYEDNLRARDHFLALGLDLTFEEGPTAHDWGYWDQQIQRVLEWLPVEPEAPADSEEDD